MLRPTVLGSWPDLLFAVLVGSAPGPSRRPGYRLAGRDTGGVSTRERAR